jgi:hypothetical protein
MRRIDPVLLRPPTGPPFVYQQEYRSRKEKAHRFSLSRLREREGTRA